MSFVPRVAPAIVLIPLLAACASAQAKGGSNKPGLNVPAPPPHEIELPAEPLEPVGEVPGTATGAGSTAPHAGRSATTKSQDPKPEGKAEPKGDAAPATAPPPEPAPPLPPPAPTPQLKTPQANTDAAAKTVRTTIDRARNTLNTVNFGPLSNERKKAYNDAKLFLQQAEDALKEGNIVFAQANATKAETLARELAGR
jgi:hypothetical protein